MSLSFHRYTLKSRSPLNSRSGRVLYEGALIRQEEDGFGYGCIHPWPELGDLALEESLQCLRDGESTPLTRRALRCAHQDAEARRAGVSLFDGLELPQSHATAGLDEESFVAARDAGFSTVKVKVGKDVPLETERIIVLGDMFPGFRWRLDFNHSCSLDEVEELLRSLGDEFCGKIDFLEDAWEEGELPGSHVSGVPLAVDRGVCAGTGEFPVTIVKPACDDVDAILESAHAHGAKVVFTSYMDHPLGQSYAAWQAGLAMLRYPAMIDSCGLVTHGLFEADAFSERLGKIEPQFHPASGTGLGFDDLLEKLPWKSLS